MPHTCCGAAGGTPRACKEQRARQTPADERLRSARELHDVVTHGMGLIAVKAGVANHIAEARPEGGFAVTATLPYSRGGGR